MKLFNLSIIYLVNGQWGNWGSWHCRGATWRGGCKTKRTRKCDNPPPSNGGETCPGLTLDESTCEPGTDLCNGKKQTFL